MKLRLIESPFTSGIPAVPGDIWRDPTMDVDSRECYAVVLPNKTVWYTTQRAQGSGNPWTFTGDPPNITVTPSIWDQDPKNGWHGWITNGELVPA